MTKVQYTVCGKEGEPRGRRRTFKVTNSAELPVRQFGLILISTLFSNSTTTSVLSRLLFSGCVLPSTATRKTREGEESSSLFQPLRQRRLRYAYLQRMKCDKTLFDVSDYYHIYIIIDFTQLNKDFARTQNYSKLHNTINIFSALKFDNYCLS